MKFIRITSLIAVVLGSIEVCFGIFGGLLMLITDNGWKAYPIRDTLITVSLLSFGVLASFFGLFGLMKKNKKFASLGVVAAIIEVLVIILLSIFG